MSKQKPLFLQHISNIIPHLNTSEKLTDIIIDKRIEFNELNSKISDYIEWQDSDEGKRLSLPKINKRHKDILFTDWDSQMKQFELTIARASGISKSIIKTINRMFHTSNLIKESDPKKLPDIKALDENWKNKSQL